MFLAASLAALGRCLVRPLLFTLALALAPTWASASGLVVFFGDSLTDSGNNALATASLTGQANGVAQVPANNSSIATFPYQPQVGWNNQTGLATYSNGLTWATTVSLAWGGNPAPSLAGGTNFAFGGATVATDGATAGFPYSLNTQVTQYLGATGGVAPAHGWYIVAGGGNDARDVLSSISGRTSPTQIADAISTAAAQFATQVGSIVDRLQAAGAQQIVVWNTPNLGVVPSVTANGLEAAQLGTQLTSSMNAALSARLASESGVMVFDVYGLLTRVSANPTAFGLTNAADVWTAASGQSVDQFLFWDGIHPTAMGQQLIAQEFLSVIPEPGLLPLVGLGLLFVVLGHRRRTRRQA